MILVVELENTLLFRNDNYEQRDGSSEGKVYIDLNEDNLGVINSNALDILKKYSKNNELLLISSKTKKEFDNTHLISHHVKCNKFILNFGYELYINNKLDIDWLVKVMHFKDKNIGIIEEIEFTMEDYFSGLFESMPYGFRVSKDNLINIKDVFKGYKFTKLYEDESYYYVVYDLFDISDVLDYVIKILNLKNELLCVSGSSDYMKKSIMKAGDKGIYNCLCLDDYRYMLLVLRGVSIVSGRSHVVGEFVMDKATEILVDNYLSP